MTGKVYDNLLIISVLMNTVFLSLDGLLDSSEENLLNTFNQTFTIIFTIDMGLKVFAFGINEYLRDRMNIFDGLIVILSLIELTIFSGGSSAISAFRSVRVFRVFRVLRVTRLIRSLKYMQVIMKVISNTISSFIYIFLLLILFNYIYALLGMQIFGGQFNYPNRLRQDFDRFITSYLCVFQILTMENWNDLLYATLRSEVNKVISLIYLISWIFMGNYVLLNLFLAILLDGFEEDDINQDIEELE